MASMTLAKFVTTDKHLASRVTALRAFKALHRARQGAFEGDERALTAGRIKINEEFRKNRDETDDKKLEKLLKIAEDSAVMLETAVVQGVHRDDGHIEVRVRDTTIREKNHPYKKDVETGDYTLEKS